MLSRNAPVVFGETSLSAGFNEEQLEAVSKVPLPAIQEPGEGRHDQRSTGSRPSPAIRLPHEQRR
jgi:hypothetical protein